MKSRAIFILPPNENDFSIVTAPPWYHCHVPSIGLVLLCSYLQAKGHDIKIIDCRELLAKYRTKEYIQFVLRIVEEFRPDVIGINMLSALFDEAKKISCALKHRFPDIQIIAGGPHPSVEPVLTLQQIPYIDAICVGPGEEVCLELLEGNNPSRIKGLMRRNHTDEFKPRPVVRDIDKYPFPDYSLVHDNHYTDFTTSTIISWGFRGLSAMTSRSCPYSCKFCASDWSKPFRYHSPEYTIEMAKYLATHDIDAITFFDDTLASIEDRLYKICEGFIGERIFYPYSKLRWFAGIRANQVKPALLKMMKRAGCFSVNLGIESGSDRMLQVINKKTTVEMNKQACAYVKEAGLCLVPTFMVGIPGETEEEMEQTLEFMRNVDCNMKGVGAFRPLPGSPFYYEFIDKKILIKQEIDWSNLGNFSIVPKYIFCNVPQERFEQIYNEALQLAYGQQKWIAIHEDVLRKFPDTIREIARTRRISICKSDNYESSHHIPFDPAMLQGKELNSMDKETRTCLMSQRKELSKKPFTRFATVEDVMSEEFMSISRVLDRITVEYNLPDHSDVNQERYPWAAGLLGSPSFYAARMWEYPFALISAELQPGMRCADIGCGMTAFTIYLMKIAKCETVGVDPDIFESGIHYKGHGVSQEFIRKTGLEIVQCGIESIDLPSNTFDRIFCLSVIEHIQPEIARRGIQEIARILKPGGRLVITVDVNMHSEISRPFGLIWDSGLVPFGEMDLCWPTRRFGIFCDGKQPADVYGMTLTKEKHLVETQYSGNGGRLESCAVPLKVVPLSLVPLFRN